MLPSSVCVRYLSRAVSGNVCPGVFATWFATWFAMCRSAGGIRWRWSLWAGLRMVCRFQSFLRPSVMVVPVRGSGWRVCLSAAGSRVHDPAPPQASSTPASQDKGKGPDQEQDQGHKQDQQQDQGQTHGEEPGLRRASATSGKLARFPRVAGSVSAAAVCGVVRSVPLGRVVSPGVQHRCPGVKSARLRSGGQVAVVCSANWTPGHRHCRRSPADATEGNEPKTGRKKSNRRDRQRGSAMRLPVRCWRRAGGQLVENTPECGMRWSRPAALIAAASPPTTDYLLPASSGRSRHPPAAAWRPGQSAIQQSSS